MDTINKEGKNSLSYLQSLLLNYFFLLLTINLKSAFYCCFSKKRKKNDDYAFREKKSQTEFSFSPG